MHVMIYGYDEGLEAGIEKGKKEGSKKEKLTIAKKLINSGMTIKEVMKITELTKEEIEKIK